MSFRNSLTVLALVAALLVPSTAGAATADLSAEARTIDAYFNSLITFLRDANRLQKKAGFTAIEVDGLQKKADVLQSQISGVESAFASAARKLTAANELASLDQSLRLKLDSKGQALFQSTSLAQLLASPALGSLASELNVPATSLRARLSTGGGTTPTVFRTSLACRAGQVKVGLIGRLGGEPTAETWDVVSCNCNPTTADGRVGMGLGTGRPCDQVLAN